MRDAFAFAGSSPWPDPGEIVRDLFRED